MSLTALDWIIVAAYFLLSVAIGLYYFDRAGQSVGEFFLSGRNLPWWLAGTSMVATTFAADTPLAVAGIVARDGVAGNWIWWNAAIGGMLTVFFFARLWRRAGIMTDVEFAELRYSGSPAAILRGFRALERVRHQIRETRSHAVIANLEVRLEETEDKYWGTISAINEQFVNVKGD